MKKDMNVAKIVKIAVIATVTVAAVCAVSCFIAKMVKKYVKLKDTKYDNPDLMEGDPEEPAGEVQIGHARDEDSVQE